MSCEHGEILRAIESVHELVEIYGQESVRLGEKQLKRLESIHSLEKKSGMKPLPIPTTPTLNSAKSFTAKYNGHPEQNKKLEEFERRFELEEENKKEILKKQKLLEIKKKQEEELLESKKREEDLWLRRILKMFASKNKTQFIYGYNVASHCGMNNIQNTLYEFRNRGTQPFILTVELFQKIKRENAETLANKYKALRKSYDWIKTHVNTLDVETTNIAKRDKFHEIIENIMNITVNYAGESPNWIRGQDEYHNGSQVQCCGHILQLYTHYVTSKTHRSSLNEHHHERGDIVHDYLPVYFEPLMDLAELLMEIIDFLSVK
jgi:hypothetical protein